MELGGKRLRSRFLRRPRSERGVYRTRDTQRVNDEGLTQEDRASATDPTESSRLRALPNRIRRPVAAAELAAFDTAAATVRHAIDTQVNSLGFQLSATPSHNPELEIPTR